MASLFLFAAMGQFPGSSSYAGQVRLSAYYGVPFPELAVTLAFLLEIVAGVALVIGWHTRLAAAVLIPYTLLLALIFYHNFSDPKQLGAFASHLALIAGLLYISVYGARHFAVQRDD